MFWSELVVNLLVAMQSGIQERSCLRACPSLGIIASVKVSLYFVSACQGLMTA